MRHAIVQARICIVLECGWIKQAMHCVHTEADACHVFASDKETVCT